MHGDAQSEAPPITLERVCLAGGTGWSDMRMGQMKVSLTGGQVSGLVTHVVLRTLHRPRMMADSGSKTPVR